MASHIKLPRNPGVRKPRQFVNGSSLPGEVRESLVLDS
jgi:hypothetical protein